jgi:hypothetical protein
VIELTGAEWFEISGRGTVAAFRNDPDQLPQNIGPRDLYHKWVIIDDKDYYIIGVETQGYSRKNFGLLIMGEK